MVVGKVLNGTPVGNYFLSKREVLLTVSSTAAELPVPELPTTASLLLGHPGVALGVFSFFGMF